jgi:hypothetical protein
MSERQEVVGLGSNLSVELIFFICGQIKDVRKIFFLKGNIYTPRGAKRNYFLVTGFLPSPSSSSTCQDGRRF